MNFKGFACRGLLTVGIVALLLAGFHPTTSGDRAPAGSFIVQGSDAATVAQTVRGLGGEVTHHLEIPIHYVRSDVHGTIWRGWSTDDFPLPSADDGTVIGQRLCQHLGGRAVFASDDRYSLHYQFVDTPAGTFFEVSHVLVDDRDHAVTVGVPFEHSRWFRGRDTDRHVASQCPEGSCCAVDPALAGKWGGQVHASVHEQPQLLAVQPGGAFPGVDPVTLYEFLESRDGA